MLLCKHFAFLTTLFTACATIFLGLFHALISVLHGATIPAFSFLFTATGHTKGSNNTASKPHSQRVRDGF